MNIFAHHTMHSVSDEVTQLWTCYRTLTEQALLFNLLRVSEKSSLNQEFKPKYLKMGEKKKHQSKELPSFKFLQIYTHDCLIEANKSNQLLLLYVNFFKKWGLIFFGTLYSNCTGDKEKIETNKSKKTVHLFKENSS